MTKRAAAKAEAREMIDLASRLAPFFPPPAGLVVARTNELSPSDNRA